MNKQMRSKKVIASIALISMLCLIAQKTYSAVSISEIMFASGERSAPQWIELYNAGTDPVNLAGWTLTIQNWDSPNLTGPVNAIITFKDGDSLQFCQAKPFWWYQQPVSGTQRTSCKDNL